MIRLLHLLALLATTVFFCVNAAAQTQTILHLENAPVYLLNHGEYQMLRDPSGKMTLADVRQAQKQGKFQPLDNNLSLGYSADAVWLYLPLQRSPSQPERWWLEIMPPFLDDIQLFLVSPEQKLDHRQSGDFFPQSQKEVNYRGTVFRLRLNAGKHEIYLRLKTTSTLVAVIKLWQPEAFSTYVRHSYFGYGAYFSLLFAVLFFNSISYLLTRRKIFIIYVLYLLINAIQWMSINGFVFEFVLGQHPLLANLTLGLSLSFAVAMAFIFFANLFEMPKYHPYIYRFMVFGSIFAIITAVATLFGYYQTFAPILLFIAIIALSLAPRLSFRLWQSKLFSNRLIMIGYWFFVVLSSLNVLGALNLIPYTESNIYFGMASNIFHILVLHFSILLQYRNIEKQNKQLLEQKMLAEHQVQMEQMYNEQQRQMLDILTHEIRTPLAMIDAANTSLRFIDDAKQSIDSDRARRYGHIQQAITRMNMVMDMIIAQKEKQELLFKPEKINIVQLSKEVISLTEIREKTHVIQLRSQQQTFYALIDPRLMRIVFLNLLDNALKYSPENTTVVISVEPQNRANQTGVLWQIRDSGIGISAGMEEKIFEKFVRGDERANQPGMGVGLFLVKCIVQRHKGDIQVRPNPEGGTIFNLWVPEDGGQKTEDRRQRME